MKKAELQSKYQLLIGGQWKDASDGKLSGRVRRGYKRGCR